MIEAVLTIAPPFPRAIMWRAALREQRNTPVMLTAMTFSHSSRGRSTEALRIAMPALLTRISICPASLTIAAKIFSIAASSLTSAACAEALAALPGNLARNRFRRRAIAVDHRDRRAGLRHGEARRFADAAAAAGHRGDRSVEPEGVLIILRHSWLGGLPDGGNL